jgi:hypothetical protein
MDIIDIHIGDILAPNKDSIGAFPTESRELISFELIAIRGSIIAVVAPGGWGIANSDFTKEELELNQERIDELAIQGAEGWWFYPKDFDSIISSGTSSKSKHSGVYDPTTSKVKSRGELEQYKQDVDFFFHDLAKPYKAPEGAWAKWI